MTLSESERRFLRKEEQRERSWRWFRWLALLGSALGVAVTAFCMRRLLDLMNDGGPALAWYAPFAWFTLIALSGLLGWTLSRWRGDLKTRLLTRLIREHDTTDAQIAPPNDGPASPVANSRVTEEPPSVS
jgi:hypothetical protein